LSFRPSYKQGFARSAGESKHPDSWKSLVGAFAPALGVTGNILHDQSPHKNHGALVNMELGTDWVVTPEGYALNFDGVNESVNLGSSSLYVAGTSSFAFGARFKTSDVDQFVISSRVSSSVDDAGWEILSGGGASVGDVRVRICNGSSVFETEIYNIADTSVPHTVFGVIDRVKNELRMYVDGVERGTPDAVSGNITNEQNPHIGKRVTTYYTGDVRELYIYRDRVPTDADIRFLHENPLALFELADLPFGVAAEVAVIGIEIFRRRIEGG
jgi:hypothetical protein